jgi:O-antigen/teichoic acid export membrane protein
MGNARVIARNSALLAGAYGVTKIFSVALTAVAARVLGPGGYGLYAMGSAFVEVGRILAGGGVPLIVTREVAKQRASSPRIAAHASLLEVLAGAAVYLLVLAAIVVIGYPREVLFCAILLGSAILLENQSDIVDAVFNGHENVVPSARAFAVGAVVHFGSGTAALLGGLGLYGYCCAAIVGFAARYVVLQFSGWRAGVIARGRSDIERDELVRLGKMAAPLLGAMVVSLMFHRMDILMLGRMVDEAEVGRYGAAVRIIDVLVLMPRVMATAAFPAMRRTLDAEGRELTAMLVAKALRLTLLLCSAVALSVWILAPWALLWVTGREFVSATPTLRILAFGVLMQAASYVFARLLVALERERDFLLIGILSLLCNFTLNLVWIPRYGIDGAALATVLSYVLNSLLYYGYSFAQGVRVPLLRASAGNLAAFFAALVVGYRLSNAKSLAEAGSQFLLPSTIAAMLLTWLLVAILLRALGWRDLSVLREMLRRSP